MRKAPLPIHKSSIPNPQLWFNLPASLGRVSRASLANAAGVLLLGAFAVELVGIGVVGIHISTGVTVARLEEICSPVWASAIGVLAGVFAVGVL